MNKPSPQHKQDRKTTIKKLIELIEITLPKFTSSSEFVTILEEKKNENQHSEAFCTFMNFSCKAKYSFGRETSQKGSHTIDISVRKPGGFLVFVIEAKVLPIPEREEHEYVYGKGGGIKRFKDNKHGINDKNNLLEENGMIAYIKKETFEYWFEKVNQWIIDAGSEESEKLNKVYFGTIAKLYSQHIRNDDAKSDLTLHHFWVYVTSQ